MKKTSQKTKKTAVKVAKKVTAKVSVYNPTLIEKKWQKKWETSKLYEVKEKAGVKKFYGLIEFPYPSGDGLHVGHIRSNTAMDIIARKRRREGFNVLYPIGWDAFGLPTENYAIKTGIQPALVTKKNSDIFRKQLKSLGFSFDWSREINTTDPNYYRWTQWIFLQLFKKGLAYKKKMAINWCPKDLIGLANEEVVNGNCERCGTPVEKRELEQWMLAITKYAERLDKDLDKVDYLEKIKIQQRNWIGKSEGAEIKFKVQSAKFKVGTQFTIDVYTTRPDTLFGVTYVVLAPEHKLVTEFLKNIENRQEVEDYINKAKKQTDIERTDAGKEKTGVELKGVKAVNPANNEEVSVWIADYVLAEYGTGAVMAVPAHDERDYAFAKKYGLAIKTVIEPFVFRTEGADAIKKDLPMVERKAIVCIIKHWEKDEFLVSLYKKNGWKGFIVGGIENNESLSDAGVREIAEETGYKNARFIKKLGTIHSQFFHEVKNVNRYAHFEVAYFELQNDNREEMSAEEKALHDIVWIKREDIEKTVNREDIAQAWSFFNKGECFTGDGLLANSGKFDGKSSESIKKEITESVGGQWVTKFKLRDWVFSRQHYWGEPIPLIHCENCALINPEGQGIVPVPEKDLPVLLPKVKNYKPTQTGESPLAAISKWVNVKCPVCKGPAKRETDTMPNWAGSSWYYLRYCDPKNKKAFADFKNLKYWTPVDWYNGGMEHTTLHLLYSRFWHKVLFDLGLVPTEEPYQKRTSHGMILAPDGEKMSKSRGNVINPDELVKSVGADTLRLYEMFMGPFDQPIAWDTNNIAGSRRFIERVWKLREKVEIKECIDADKIIHKTIKKITDDIEAMRFNTAISALMIAINELEKFASIGRKQYETILQLLAPFAPHFTEELWSVLGNKKSIHVSLWPVYDPKMVLENEVTIMIQVNGKIRGSFTAPTDTSKEDIEKMVKEVPEIKKWLEGKEIRKVIVVPNKLVNVVIA